MDMPIGADDVLRILGLSSNATCGSTHVSYVSRHSIAPGGLPEPLSEARPVGSALYFMVTPSAPVRLHRIRNDQLYHYYLGDPLELFLLHTDGKTERIIVGPDLVGGQRVQVPIPGGTFHTARIIGEKWFLGGSTAWPGVLPSDVEMGDTVALANKYSAVAEELHAIANKVRV